MLSAEIKESNNTSKEGYDLPHHYSNVVFFMLTHSFVFVRPCVLTCIQVGSLNTNDKVKYKVKVVIYYYNYISITVTMLVIAVSVVTDSVSHLLHCILVALLHLFNLFTDKNP